MSRASMVTSMRTSADFGCGAGEAEGEEVALLLGLGLEAQALERPVAALLDARRDAREGRQAAERTATTGELERGHVVLVPVVVARERRRPQEIDRAVGPDQSAAG